MTKLFSLDIETLKTFEFLPKEVSNQTCRFIIKTLIKLQKDPEFGGMTGQEIMEECKKNGWPTKQDQEKFHTTFSYYQKKLKVIGLKVVGEIDTKEEVSVKDLMASLN